MRLVYRRGKNKNDNEMENNDIDALIVAFVEGEVSKEDMKHLEELTFSSEENRWYVRNCIETLLATAVVSNPTSFDSNKAFLRFAKRVSSKIKLQNSNFRIPRWVKYAAAAAVALLIILPVTSYLRGKQQTLGHFKQICMEVPNGSQTTLTMPDGTIVRLNSGSKLTYSQGFGITNREVKLNGEAYFKVVHQEKLPFKIHTDNLVIIDKGTEFVCRNYGDEKQAEVQLLEGSVAIYNKTASSNTEISMKPGERVVFDKPSGTWERDVLYLTRDQSIAMSELYFDNMTISDIAKVLIRCYGVNIKVARDIGDKTFNGAFDRTKNTVDDILDDFSRTHQLNYKKTNDTYVIY